MPIGPSPPSPSLSDLWQELQDTEQVPTPIIKAVEDAAVAAVRGALCGGGELLDFAARRGLATRRARKNAQAVAGILKLACPNVGPGDPLPPSLVPVPKPGQCPVIYSVSVDYTFANALTGNTIERFDQVAGNILGPASISLGEKTICPLNPSFKPLAQQIVVQQGDGSTGPIFSFPGCQGVEKINAIRWTRNDGGDDNCGEPELPPFPPPGPPDFPIVPPGSPSPPIPTVDPDGNPGPPIIIAPTVGPIFIGIGGAIIAPVNVNISGPTINAPINIPVNINLPDFKPTFVFPPAGTKPGPGDPFPDPGPPEEICCEPDPEEDEDPEEDDPLPEVEEDFETVVGATVRCQLSDIRATAVFPTDPAAPTLYVPRLGSLYFRIESAGGNLWSVDYPIKSVEQFVPAPSGARVIAARFDPERGVTGTTRLVKQSSNRKKP